MILWSFVLYTYAICRYHHKIRLPLHTVRRHIIEDFSTVNYRKKDGMKVLSERRCQSVISLLINHFVKQRSHVTLYLCISYWNLILLIKMKLIKFIDQNEIDNIYCS